MVLLVYSSVHVCVCVPTIIVCLSFTSHSLPLFLFFFLSLSLSLPLRYISLDSNGCIELCGGRELGDKYLQKLVGCMETVFREKNNVVTALVADVNQYVYKNAGGCTVYVYMYMHVVYMHMCRYFTLQICMLHAVCVFVELIWMA